MPLQVLITISDEHSNKGIAKMMIGVIYPNLLYVPQSNKNGTVAKKPPINKDPESPRYIFAGGLLNNKKAISAPRNAISKRDNIYCPSNNEKTIYILAITIAIVATRPSITSIKLNALINKRNQKAEMKIFHAFPKKDIFK